MAKKKTKAQKRQEKNARAKTKANITNGGKKRAACNNNNSLAPSGLRNNGNTCYYNSTMQCLAQVYTLSELLEERSSSTYQWNALTVTRKNKKANFHIDTTKVSLCGSRSTIVTQFLSLVKNIVSKSSTAPSHLLDEIRTKYPQFRGHSQQDAHELCLSLISQMRDEEIALQKKSVCSKYKINMKNPTDEDKTKAQVFKYSISYTPLDAVFGGQLVSWVKCCDCSHVSLHFERFYDLSLSIPSDDSYPSISNRRRKGSVVENLPSSDEDSDDDGREKQGRERNDSVESDMGKLSISDKRKKRAERKAARKLERGKLAKAKENAKANRKKESSASEPESSSSDKEDKENSDSGACDIGFEVTKELRLSCENLGNDKIDFEEVQCNDEKTEEKQNEFNKEVLQPMVYQAETFENKTLGELLKKFITFEILQGDNKYICEHCSKKKGSKSYSSKAIKGQMIALPPQTLIIQLKRFETTGILHSRIRNTRKCNSKVEFPAKLNISPFTSRIYEFLAPFYEPEMKVPKDSQAHILDYNLLGVVVHLGDLGHGHYIAYVKVRNNLRDDKENRKFLHLKQFFPDFDHVFKLWHKAKNSIVCNGNTVKNAIANGYSGSDSSDTDCSTNSNHRNESESTTSSSSKKGKNALSDGDDTNSDEDDGGEDADGVQKKKKQEDTSCWFYCSDSEVRTCEEEDVLRSCYGQYFMLYERSS